METFETRSVRGTLSLGRKLAARLRAGDCVALIGELGSGKTVLVRGIAGGLGVGDTRLVSSPTFVLVHEYAARLPIYHVDLYRLSEPSAELRDLGLDEMLARGVVLIEWAERAAGALPSPRWQIDIEVLAERRRRFALRRME
ncbi:MAG TPA: tRNA (adenosine(37)-N6)-threonylcarbamoyltransferase complex ATPase subunit type 1 TsaE [Phycisphaerae bacterium]|nr:tRNA (adenosine(37)-N6)-threonylcarbamoyltransferase complex ATPase subunit type 1 TsaE [Phycisphaerae bacterium]HUT57780.1 tRNA (adenosine(37)-N6)-threonylcarbamoyltransferase complex ATPase subunit type 1 TsaE [Phycisphaerae bacterium]